MDSVSKIRFKRKVMLILASSLLLIIIVYGVMRPSEEEQEYDRLKGIITSGNPQDMNNESRQEMRNSFDKLSPATRKKLIRVVMRSQLDRAREETAGLDLEAKIERIDKMVKKTRERFSKLSNDRKSEIRERLNSEEGRQQVKEGMSFYYTEFSAKERELMDPLVEEILNNLNSI